MISLILVGTACKMSTVACKLSIFTLTSLQAIRTLSLNAPHVGHVLASEMNSGRVQLYSFNQNHKKGVQSTIDLLTRQICNWLFPDALIN